MILSQDEYTEHHSSITHSRFSPSSAAVASMDIDGVWSKLATPTIFPLENSVYKVDNKSAYTYTFTEVIYSTDLVYI